MSQLSYVHDACGQPLFRKTHGAVFDGVGEAYADALALIMRGSRWPARIAPEPGAALETEAVKEFRLGLNARRKIPRHIEFVEGFPVTVTGKVQKFAEREAMIAELDLAPEKTA